jgi:hypothetical protein
MQTGAWVGKIDKNVYKRGPSPYVGNVVKGLSLGLINMHYNILQLGNQTQ